MSSSMQHDHAALWCGLDVGEHALDVQVAPLGVPVPVWLVWDASLVHDGVVGTPGRGGDVHCSAGRETLHELGAEAQRAGPGEGLRGGDAASGHERGVLTEEHLLAELDVGDVATLR